jgi:hypothetical protein
MNIFGFKAKRTGFERFKMIHDSTCGKVNFSLDQSFQVGDSGITPNTLCEKEKDKNS